MKKVIRKDWIERFGFIGSVNDIVHKAETGLFNLNNNLLLLRGVNEDYKKLCEVLIFGVDLLHKDLRSLLLERDDVELNKKIKFERDIKEYKLRKAVK